MKVAIIGCGLIGRKRVQALGNHELVCAADIDPIKAEGLCALRKQGVSSARWQDAVNSDADIVIIATTNNWLAPIAAEAIRNGKHVLMEKPGARTPGELFPLIEQATIARRWVKVGFNLRYHPGIAKAKQIVDSGAIGELLCLRARYGHGGRVGYDKEWRADPEIAGGGELIDQGVHLIDLSRWFLGEFAHIDGFTPTYFWDMPVEDNGFVALRTDRNKMAWLHVSCSEWKNLFCLEIYGKTGKLQIDGLGGSYGTEKLTHYQMLPHMGPPTVLSWDYPGDDRSWTNEFAAFVAAINSGSAICGGLNDALKALEIVDVIYRKNSGQRVSFDRDAKNVSGA